MKISGIYGWKNSVNGKWLIGSSLDIKSRLSVYRTYCRKGAYCNQHFQAAWTKYGESCFEFSILEECPASMLLVREDAWMDYYHSRDPQCGYNMKGASREIGIPLSQAAKDHLSKIKMGHSVSEEARKRMSASMKGRPSPMKGKHHADSAKKKLSEAHLGKCFLSDEERTKLSQRMMGNSYTKGMPAWNRGVPRTEAEKAKMSAANMGHTPWNRGIPRTPEERLKMSIARKGMPSWNKGKHLTPEQLKKHIDARRNHPSPLIGRPHTAETRMNQSAGIRAYWDRKRLEARHQPEPPVLQVAS